MNNNYENLPAVLNANQLAAALGISRAERISSLTRGRSPRCVSASGCLCRRISSSTGSSRTREAGMATEKETTAPIPSVAPDGEQPSALARTDSITEIEETHKQFGKIQIMTMPELMETRFRVRPAVIDGLLPAGTYLLAGAPKIGKSFLVLQMAYQVSMGAPFLGFSSRQGTVLYLALEDTCERLQKRLAQMTEQDSEHLILSVFSETLDEGLTERLSDFWSEHTDTVLIIIDTLQRVRGRTPDNGSYAADYDTLARLKEFSDTYGVTVLVVHHTRKEGAEDVFNMISGTNGLMGAADGALLLHKDKRTASDAVLEVVGRDQPQLRLHLRFAAAHLCWEMLEAETERYREPPCPLLEVLSRLVNEENPSWNGTATELAQCLSKMDSSQSFTPNWIVRTLNAQQDTLLRKYDIRYVAHRTREGKSLSLRWDGVR